MLYNRFLMVIYFIYIRIFRASPVTAGTPSAAERSHPMSEVRATVWRSHPVYEARVRGREEPPHIRGQGRRSGRSTHVQGAVAALAQEGLEELSHVEGQEGRQSGDTLCPR